MEIVKTEAEERTFVQKLLDTSWPALHPIVGQLLGRGGQAVVYKLTFADGHSEALKVILRLPGPRPAEGCQPPGTFRDSAPSATDCQDRNRGQAFRYRFHPSQPRTRSGCPHVLPSAHGAAHTP